MITAVMSLLEWARRNNMSRSTAYRRYKDGTLPIQTRRTPTGRIVVDITPEDCAGACLPDVHMECLVSAIVTQLERQGYRLDQPPASRHNG